MNTLSYPTDQELNRVLTLSEAAHLCSLSIDTLRRRYKDKICDCRLAEAASGFATCWRSARRSGRHDETQRAGAAA